MMMIGDSGAVRERISCCRRIAAINLNVLYLEAMIHFKWNHLMATVTHVENNSRVMLGSEC